MCKEFIKQTLYVAISGKHFLIKIFFGVEVKSMQIKVLQNKPRLCEAG